MDLGEGCKERNVETLPSSRVPLCRLVSHFGAGRIGAFTHEAKADDGVAVRAYGPDSLNIDGFKLILFEPH